MLERGGMRQLRWFAGSMASYFGFLMVANTWDPYDVSAIALKTGYPGLTMDHLRNACLKDPLDA